MFEQAPPFVGGRNAGVCSNQQRCAGVMRLLIAEAVMLCSSATCVMLLYSHTATKSSSEDKSYFRAIASPRILERKRNATVEVGYSGQRG